MKIDDLMQMPDWESVLEEKGISIKKDFPYVILKYGIEANWSDDIVKQCRGVIFKETNSGYECVCRPFDKFYNVQETNASDIDWKTAKVQEKVDGSLVKLWFDNDSWHWSTMGTIDADKAPLDTGELTFGDVIRKTDNYNDIDFDSLDKDYTYMFELVSPYNRIVLAYPEPHLYHVGTRAKTGEEYDINIGVEKPKQYPLGTLDDCLKAADAMNKGEVNQEGFVVVDDDWNRVKIKSAKYVALHHVASDRKKWTAKNLVDVIDSPTLDDAIKEFPLLGESVSLYKKAVVRFYRRVQKEMDMARAYYEEYDFDRKATAEKIKKFRYKSPGFWALDNEGDAKDFISHMRPNKYYEYLDNLVVKIKEEKEMKKRAKEELDKNYTILRDVPDNCIKMPKSDKGARLDVLVKFKDDDKMYNFFVTRSNVYNIHDKNYIVFDKHGAIPVCIKDMNGDTTNVRVMKYSELKDVYDSFSVSQYSEKAEQHRNSELISAPLDVDIVDFEK